MKKLINKTTTYTLTQEDIQKAFYDFFVKEFRNNNINAFFKQMKLK